MFSLYFLGTYLIRLVGTGRFIITYFVGGIIGSLFLVIFAITPFLADIRFIGAQLYLPAIGASGAVAAVCGSLIILRPKMKVFIIPIPIPLPLWVVVIFLSIILSAIVPGVAWQAHLGGLAFGLITGFFFRRRQRRILFDL